MSRLCGWRFPALFLLTIGGCGGTSAGQPPGGPAQDAIAVTRTGAGAITSTPGGIYCGACSVTADASVAPLSDWFTFRTQPAKAKATSRSIHSC